MVLDQLTNDTRVNLAKCVKGNQSHTVCFSQDCKKKAFVCRDKNCQCQKDHTLCLRLQLQSLQKTILSKSYSLEFLEEKIEKIFDDAIDKLSDERDRAIKEVRDNNYYIGLNQQERKLIDVVRKGKNDTEIDCQFVWNLHLGLKGPTEMKISMDEIENEIEKIGQDIQKQQNVFARKLTNLLERVKTWGKEMFEISKIVKSIDDQNKLIAFFDDKKVEKMKLLYRASENEFLVSKFHEKCDKIPCTLVICETEFGKVIGGFTTFCWEKSTKQYGGHWLSTTSNPSEHFLFSLTNNDKFVIMSKISNCIFLWSDDQYGPIFGDGYDFVISDKANQNNNSCANIGYTYTHPNYKYDSPSLQKLTGSDNDYFKVNEWQVWQVQFRQ